MSEMTLSNHVARNLFCGRSSSVVKRAARRMVTKWILLLVALIYGCHAQPLPPNFIVLVTVSPAACWALAMRHGHLASNIGDGRGRSY